MGMVMGAGPSWAILRGYDGDIAGGKVALLLGAPELSEGEKDRVACRPMRLRPTANPGPYGRKTVAEAEQELASTRLGLKSTGSQ